MIIFVFIAQHFVDNSLSISFMIQDNVEHVDLL